MESKRYAYLVALVLFAAQAMAYVDLESDSEGCFSDGSFTFRAWNGKPGQLFTKDIKITVWHPSSGLKFAPQGQWSDEIIWFTIYDPGRKFATYASKPGTLNASGDYRVSLEYEGCREGMRCIEHVNLDQCPGLDYNCKSLDLQVTSCSVRTSEAIIEFEVPRASYASSIRPYKDLNFYLKSNYQDLDGVDKIPGLAFDRPDNSTFRMTVPLRKDEIIGAAAVAMKACDSPSTPQKLVPCKRYVAPEPIQAQEELPPEPPAAIVMPGEEAREVTPIAVGEVYEEPAETPSVVIPMHIIVLAIAIAIGIVIIVRSSRPSHRKIRSEEE